MDIVFKMKLKEIWKGEKARESILSYRVTIFITVLSTDFYLVN